MVPLDINQVLAMANEPWAQAMQDCEHESKEHHAEGDVWTHTLMVLDQLWEQPEYKDLSNEEQVIVSWGALLHDVAKPTTCVFEDGRVRFPKHSIKGVRLARHILVQNGFDWRTREKILALIRYHGQPPFILQSKNPQNWTIDLSWKVNTKLLYILCMADAMGRKAENMSEYPEWVQLWRMMAEENECFGKPYSFLNNHARFLFFRDLLSSLYYIPFEGFKCQMTIMSGLPGVGKDTWIAKNLPSSPVVSLDGLRIEMDVGPTDDQGPIVQEAKQRVRQLLAAKTSFVVNATCLLESSRLKWTRLAQDYEASTRIVYLERPLPIIFQQNKQRDAVVPEYIIESMFDSLEVPNLTECHEMIEI